MRFLLDTNVLIRLSAASEPEHELTTNTIGRLMEQRHELFVTDQALREFWHVCTRSRDSNGKAMSAEQTAQLLDAIEATSTVVYGTSESFARWRAIISEAGVTGALCHDANHVAIALANGIDNIITFDVADFRKLNVSGLTIVHPAEIQ
ncbi:MAG: type II toxin-antitoxin system VapC family toxin [Fimbriimonas sp.]